MRKLPLAVVACAVVLSAAAWAGTDPGEPSVGTALTARIRRVTVYSDRARITRGVTFALSGSRQRVYVPDLPVSLEDGSVSASFPGSKTAKILSIEVETTYGKQTSRKDAEALIEKGKTLDRKMNAINDDLAALSAEEQFLRSFQVKTRPDEKGRLVPVTLEPAAWAATLGFVSEGLNNVLMRERAKQQEARDLQKQREALNVDLQKVQSYESEATKRIAMEIEGTGNADLEVVYAISGPSWRPAYDVRVLSSLGKVEVVTHGVVRQQTGEDWKDVDLTLSTASPEVGADLPQLLAWRLGDADQYALAAQTGAVGQMGAGLATSRPAPAAPPMSVASAGEAKAKKRAPSRSRAKGAEVAAAPSAAYDGEMDAKMEMEERPMAQPYPMPMPAAKPSSGMANGPMNGYYKAPPPPPPPPPAVIREMGPNVWSLPAGHAFSFQNNAAPTFSWSGDVLYCPSPVVSAGGFDFAFKPERKSTVMSDGRERKVRLSSTRFAAELQYEIVAPISTKAYLRATVKNDTKHPFLAGESFVFLDDDFVGRAFLNTVAPTEKLDLSLGVDDDVKVERRAEQTAENTGVFTKKERTVYTTLLQIKSFKKRSIDVLLRDQIPITWQKDDITVETITLNPKPNDDKGGSAPEQGLYAWKMTIPAGEKRDVKVKYAIEHPRDFDLVQTRGN